MSPKLKRVLIRFTPKMKRYPSAVWNRVTRYEDATGWLPEAREAISRLERLGENWDGYGSRPIQGAAITNAVHFIFEIPPRLVPAPHISPTPGGGIGFHWRISGRDLEIEFNPNGAVEAMKSFPGTDREPEEKIIQETEWESAVRWVSGLT